MLFKFIDIVAWLNGLQYHPVTVWGAGSNPVVTAKYFGSVAIIGWEQRPVKSKGVGSSPIAPAKMFIEINCGVAQLVRALNEITLYLSVPLIVVVW